MNNHISYERWIALLLLFCLIGLSACGLKSSAQATGAGGTDKPIGTGATPEPGNNGQPTPMPDGHSQSMVAANGSVYVGSDNGMLYALNASDGTVRWHQALNSFVTVSAVKDGTVYVSTDGAVSAFDAASGIRRWQHAVDGSNGVSPLMFGDGALFFSVTLSNNNNARAIYALRTTDGTQLWRYSTTSATPVFGGVVNGIVYSIEVVGDVMQGDQHVVAIRASDGRVLWRLHIESTDGQTHGTPLEGNGIVYIGTDSGAIYALRIATGTIVWHVVASIQGDNKPPAIGAMPIEVADEVVYVNTPQGILARRASDGALLWQKKSAFLPFPFLQAPIVNNGRVYVASSSGTIYALRTQDGSQIWQFSNTPLTDPFIIENGLIYINVPNKIYALREQDGQVVWQQSLDHHDTFSSSDTSLLVTEKAVYVSKDNGVVQALRASDGKSLWNYVIQEQAVPTDPVYGASITFASSVSYQQALKSIADLGLQLGIFCPSMWKPQVSEKDIFSYHSLLIIANVNSAPLWLNRLKATVGVEDIQAAGVHSCPHMGPDTAYFHSHLQQSETFLRVTFSASVSYDNALETVSNLWFRMADPCYEQARAQGTKPTWSSQGQVDTFAKTHSFVVATTGLNSIHWSNQLHAVAGVVKVDVPLKMSC